MSQQQKSTAWKAGLVVKAEILGAAAAIPLVRRLSSLLTPLHFYDFRTISFLGIYEGHTSSKHAFSKTSQPPAGSRWRSSHHKPWQSSPA